MRFKDAPVTAQIPKSMFASPEEAVERHVAENAKDDKSDTKTDEDSDTDLPACCQYCLETILDSSVFLELSSGAKHALARRAMRAHKQRAPHHFAPHGGFVGTGRRPLAAAVLSAIAERAPAARAPRASRRGLLSQGRRRRAGGDDDDADGEAFTAAAAGALAAMHSHPGASAKDEEAYAKLLREERLNCTRASGSASPSRDRVRDLRERLPCCPLCPEMMQPPVDVDDLDDPFLAPIFDEGSEPLQSQFAVNRMGGIGLSVPPKSFLQLDAAALEAEQEAAALSTRARSQVQTRSRSRLGRREEPKAGITEAGAIGIGAAGVAGFAASKLAGEALANAKRGESPLPSCCNICPSDTMADAPSFSRGAQSPAPTMLLDVGFPSLNPFKKEKPWQIDTSLYRPDGCCNACPLSVFTAQNLERRDGGVYGTAPQQDQSGEPAPAVELVHCERALEPVGVVDALHST